MKIELVTESRLVSYTLESKYIHELLAEVTALPVLLTRQGYNKFNHYIDSACTVSMAVESHTRDLYIMDTAEEPYIIITSKTEPEGYIKLTKYTRADKFIWNRYILRYNLPLALVDQYDEIDEAERANDASYDECRGY